MLCLGTATAKVVLVTAGFTLSWMHSVEKITWQEHYRLDNQGLLLTEARVQGSGAGMEPPPEARLQDGAWYWQPNIRLPQVVLADSEFTADYTLCLDSGLCRPLSHWLPAGQGVTLSACTHTEVN
ncbi:DUF1850 domain-containing protein [Zobellella maritima]|uniref:DUF1850 domain-containing protein n=1 Tax=Zobellella maritima TaxID=2059725 RepID=UPI000E300E53|nr:DUF1850 domain-containing protein [Zobellella maritima]